MSDISTLDENSKVVFFNNLFNIMTGITLIFLLRIIIITYRLFLFLVHSIISRGYSGSSLYDKCNFMRTTKYNVNALVFNLLEVHSLLIICG